MFLDYPKSKKQTLIEKFDRRLQELYFASEKNILDVSVKPQTKQNFFILMDLLSTYANSDEKKQKDLKLQIECLTVKNPDVIHHYISTSKGKKDLATYAAELDLPLWAIYMTNGEHTADRIAREKFEEMEDRTNGHSAFEEDDEDEKIIPKTKHQKELFFLMCGTKGHSFGVKLDHEADLPSKLIKEFDILPHKPISIKMENGEEFSTTPFLYFLQRHCDAKKPPIVPNSLKDSFYNSVDPKFENFEKNCLGIAFLKANLFQLFAEYMINLPKELKSNFENKAERIKQQKEKIVLNKEESIQNVEYFQPELFPIEEFDTSKQIKPKLVSSHRTKITTDSSNEHA